MIEALAPFYGLDPEPEISAGASAPTDDRYATASPEWLRGMLQAAEERVRDLEEELSEVEREAQTS